jgi:hypothetical protein
MPLKYWDEAFLTTFYLINRLPSRVIHNKTPIELLFKSPPDYSFLRTFGCAVWPNLRSYNQRKLQLRYTQCVFLGYSGLHKGYKRLDIATGRLYISRDVTFDESVYPFPHLHPNAEALLHTKIQLLPSVLRNPSILDQENELRHDHMSVSANFSLDDSLQEASVAGNSGANLKIDPAANSRDSHAESASGSGPQDPPATPASSQVRSNLRSPLELPRPLLFLGPAAIIAGAAPMIALMIVPRQPAPIPSYLGPLVLIPWDLLLHTANPLCQLLLCPILCPILCLISGCVHAPKVAYFARRLLRMALFDRVTFVSLVNQRILKKLLDMLNGRRLSMKSFRH